MSDTDGALLQRASSMPSCRYARTPRTFCDSSWALKLVLFVQHFLAHVLQCTVYGIAHTAFPPHAAADRSTAPNTSFLTNYLKGVETGNARVIARNAARGAQAVSCQLRLTRYGIACKDLPTHSIACRAQVAPNSSINISPKVCAAAATCSSMVKHHEPAWLLRYYYAGACRPLGPVAQLPCDLPCTRQQLGA